MLEVQYRKRSFSLQKRMDLLILLGFFLFLNTVATPAQTITVAKHSTKVHNTRVAILNAERAKLKQMLTTSKSSRDKSATERLLGDIASLDREIALVSSSKLRPIRATVKRKPSTSVAVVAQKIQQSMDKPSYADWDVFKNFAN